MTDPAKAGSRPGRLRFEGGEGRAVAALAAIYGIRMLGLFIMFPVLVLYGRSLPGGSAALAGLAIGAYGLAQAVLQIPFGILSDRLGRRPVIALGLGLFALGSLLGAAAGSIGAVILARVVQGSGAVSGPVTALLADLTRPAIRTRAMALIGISIGGAFILALVAAPLLAASIGVPGIFLVTAALAGFALIVLYAVVPTPPGGAVPARARGPLAPALDRSLWPHYFGIFALSAALSATFFAAPLALHDYLGIEAGRHWRTYLGVFLASIPPTALLVLASERSRAPDRIMRAGIAVLVVALAASASVLHDYAGLAVTLAIFFTAFNYLEARLPARLSQAAEPSVRGAALSVFATAQFLGSFAGAALGGPLSSSALGLGGVFIGVAVLSLAWFFVARTAPRNSGD